MATERERGVELNLRVGDDIKISANGAGMRTRRSATVRDRSMAGGRGGRRRRRNSPQKRLRDNADDVRSAQTRSAAGVEMKEWRKRTGNRRWGRTSWTIRTRPDWPQQKHRTPGRSTLKNAGLRQQTAAARTDDREGVGLITRSSCTQERLGHRVARGPAAH